VRFAPLGDRAVMITLGATIDEATHRLVRSASARIDRRPPSGFVDQVPAFTSIAVHYDPLVAAQGTSETPYARVVGELTAALDGLTAEKLPPARVVEIPVCYGGALGPDLEDVASAHAMTADEVVRLHTGGDYLVYMVGFMPGFAYLGGLSGKLATPRRTTPRTVVPAGTVGIGGSQTGVYPLDSPGGWNLIGKTPLAIFDIARAEPALLATGDRVRFRSITESEFRNWSASR
jgi:inhibitor of KinA